MREESVPYALGPSTHFVCTRQFYKMKRLLKTPLFFATPFALVCACALESNAQVGVLDQFSPMDTAASSVALFSVSLTLPFQQQVVAGTSGQLSGIRIKLYGAVGSGMRLRVRMGQSWSLRPVVFDTMVNKSAPGYQSLWIDMSEANIVLAEGDHFVIETFAVLGVTAGKLVGNYRAPALGLPFYSQPLFFAGIPFTDGGWRHGFETYMITDEIPCVADINSDGGIDGSDVHDFFNAWEAGEVNADINIDGGIDGSDVSDFIDAWIEASC